MTTERPHYYETIHCPECDDVIHCRVTIGKPDTRIARCHLCNHRFTLGEGRKLAKRAQLERAEPAKGNSATPLHPAITDSPRPWYLTVRFYVWTAVALFVFVGFPLLGRYGSSDSHVVGVVAAIFWVALMISFGLMALGLYFLPTIVAWTANRQQLLAIFMLNLFLGWALIGWVAAMVWAAIQDNPQESSKTSA